MDLIRLENITKTYRLGEVDLNVLKGVSLTIRRGEMIALMGASGSGKTTLMNILGCLDRPTSGRYWLDGQEMSGLNANRRALVRTAKLGFVFQSFNLLPRTTAKNNVVMPLDYAAKRPPGKEARRLAQSLLEEVGLGDRLNHEPSQMSGGQQQRVAIARALVNRPALVLADEPTGNLDSKTSVEILRMFQQLNAEGITVVLVTHDPKVASFAHRTIQVADGLIVEEQAPERAELLELTSSGPAHAGPSEPRGPHSRSRADSASRRRLWPFSRGRAFESAEGTPGIVVPRIAASVATVDDPMIHTADAEIRRAPSYSRSTTGSAIVTEIDHVLTQTQRRADAVARVIELPSPKHRPRGFALPNLLPITLRSALNALRRNKLRSALTALGVIIGVGAVIAMTEIGQGSRLGVQKIIASMGANNLLIFPGAAMSGSVSFGSGSFQTLKPDDMDEILRQCPAVSEVAPIVWARAQVVYGNRNWVPKSLSGTAPSYIRVREWEIDEGEMFTDRDVHNGSNVCLIGATLKHELFQDESPLGKDVRIQNVTFRVVGVLAKKGANMLGQDQDDTVIAPWTTVKFRVNAGGAGSTTAAAQTVNTQNAAATLNSLDNLYPTAMSLYDVPSVAQAADTPQLVRFINFDMMIAKAGSTAEVPLAIDQITALLRERHHLRPERGNDFDIRDMTEVQKKMSSAADQMGVLLMVVAAISLVVGGVGIMNIMLVSVTERTREIGLRMAVGARDFQILRQFLVEAVLLCLLGGAVGIALGRITSILVRQIKNWPTEPSIPVIVLAVVISAGVGIIFGFYPAWKASRLDPIEALRYE